MRDRKGREKESRAEADKCPVCGAPPEETEGKAAGEEETARLVAAMTALGLLYDGQTQEKVPRGQNNPWHLFL